MNADPNITDWLNVLIAFLLLFLSILVWRLNRRVTWLTGALESHSTLMLRLEAKRGVDGKPIKVVWWDPNREKLPFKGAHGVEAELEQIYLYLPPEHRECNRGFWRRVWAWFK